MAKKSKKAKSKKSSSSGKSKRSKESRKKSPKERKDRKKSPKKGPKKGAQKETPVESVENVEEVVESPPEEPMKVKSGEEMKSTSKLDAAKSTSLTAAKKSRSGIHPSKSHSMSKTKFKSASYLASRHSFESEGSEYSEGSEEGEEYLERLAAELRKRKRKRKPSKEDKKKKAAKPKAAKAATPKKKQKKKPSEEPSVKEEAAEEAPPEVDIMEEINRMKALAEAQAAGLDVDAASAATPSVKSKKSQKSSAKKKKKKRRGPKKKLSKKEKLRLAAEKAERLRIEAEADAARRAEEERIRAEEERKAAIEKEKRDLIENQLRAEQMEAWLDISGDLIGYNLSLRDEEKQQEEWQTYVNCDRLPDATKCDDMTTFLHLWELTMDDTTMPEAARRTEDVLHLLDDLNESIDTCTDREDYENFTWIRSLFREHQKTSLDVATYRLLRNIDKNLHRIDIPTADFQYEDNNLVVCIWLPVQLPIPLPNPRRPPKPRIEIDFPQMKMDVQFPSILDADKLAIRSVYTKYDHLSDTCETFAPPPVPPTHGIELYDFVRNEWREKLLYKWNNRVRPPPPPPKEDEEETEVEPEPEIEFGPEDDIPLVPYRKLTPTASDYVLQKEEMLYTEIRESMVKTVEDDVINLRKFAILGGVYAIHLLKQPPQPQDFVTLDMQLTPLYLPKQLEYAEFDVEYVAPAPPEAGIRRLPEEIEEELKQQEEELDKLILFNLTWPEHVIFLELPIVCLWDESKCQWTKNDVYDLKHNEEKCQLSFRTKKFGTFGLAALKYTNLPYQAWEVRPEADGTVSLQITAAILLVEFNVKNGLVALSVLQNSPNNALQDIVGEYFKLGKLMKLMQKAGVDVFPALDAFCYVDGVCEKQWPNEKQAYFNMAQLSGCYNFAWSRWNVTVDRRTIVMQMREYNVLKTKQKNHQMVMITPLKAIYVDCTEVSPNFTEEGVENMKFYSDLFCLVKSTSSMAIKNKLTTVNREMVYALYELLLATRLVSFS